MTDAERWLEDKGWRVLRFWNNDVLAAPNPHPPIPNGLGPSLSCKRARGL
jgi:hypothetical protein